MAGAESKKSSRSHCAKDTLLPPSPLYILRGAESPVTVLEFTEPVCGTLLSGCQDGKVHLWNLDSRRSKESFDAHSGKSVLFLKSEDGSKKLMTQGRDGYFKLWKNTGPAYELYGKLEADGDGFCSAVLLPQNTSTQLIALAGKDSTINIYNLASWSLVRTLASSSGSSELGLCMCMCAVSNQAGITTQLVAGYESGKLVLWDIPTGKVMHQSSVYEDAVMCMAYSSPEFSRGLLGSVDETLVAWKVSEAGNIEIIKRLESTNAGFNDVAIRTDNRIAATAGWDNTVRVFSMKSLRPLAILAYHRDSVQCVQFSQNHLLAAGSKDHLISMWDIYRKM